MFYTNHNIFFYLNHIRCRAFIYGLYVLFHILFFNKTIQENPWKTFYHLSIPGSLQTILLLLTHFQEPVPGIQREQNPLMPFAISRELVLVAVKRAPLPAERDE